jgi:hypothetical protein
LFRAWLAARALLQASSEDQRKKCCKEALAGYGVGCRARLLPLGKHAAP